MAAIPAVLPFLQTLAGGFGAPTQYSGVFSSGATLGIILTAAIMLGLRHRVRGLRPRWAWIAWGALIIVGFLTIATYLALSQAFVIRGVDSEGRAIELILPLDTDVAAVKPFNELKGSIGQLKDQDVNSILNRGGQFLTLAVLFLTYVVGCSLAGGAIYWAVPMLDKEEPRSGSEDFPEE